MYNLKEVLHKMFIFLMFHDILPIYNTEPNNGNVVSKSMDYCHFGRASDILSK